MKRIAFSVITVATLLLGACSLTPYDAEPSSASGTTSDSNTRIRNAPYPYSAPLG